MNRLLPVVILTTILLQTSLAQTTFKISSYNETPEAFKYLLLSNAEIAANDTINEKILDLVEPMLVDSVIEKRKQFHRVFLVGPMIHAFGGYNWRAVDMKKQKFVGTVKNHGRSGSFEYTEWDIKFHLKFHLKEYLWKEMKAYDLQKKYHRQDIRPSHRTDYKVPPFVRDTNNLDINQYDLGTELTPPPAFIPQLNYLFFPTLPEAGPLKNHPNFGTEHPSMGFYGVTCLDCNHNCHSEMHPYEWVWWLNVDTNKYLPESKEWLIGLFHEGSNRFKNWSQNPMTGDIAIPFAFEYDSEDPSVPFFNVQSLVFNRFKEAELKKLPLPENALSPNANFPEVVFMLNDSTEYNVSVNFSLPTQGIKYFFSNLNLDPQSSILSGYFHVSLSVEDLYTARILVGRSY